jgi:murein DD-endopeptidase MepM/ murein hydrolase activator NlpD
MIASRREFLGFLAGLPVVLARRSVFSNDSGPISSAPTELAVKNHNGDGKYVITEGKVLLVALSFPENVDDPVGSLPVKIQPESAGGQQLTEPQPLFFYSTRDERTFRMFLAAPLDAVEGSYTASIVGRQGEARPHWDIKYLIRRGNYRESTLAVDKSFSKPTPEAAARMNHDFEIMRDIYKKRTSRRWSQSFVRPVPGSDKDNFGDKRTYNETKHLRHSGLDYRASIGTPVSAINDGIVALSGEELVAGQTICVDHGGGVFSKYMHLSHRKVQLGDAVKRGDIIALSGSSGAQKPSPHLHLDLVVHGVHVDPKDFMRVASMLIALEANDGRSRS